MGGLRCGGYRWRRPRSMRYGPFGCLALVVWVGPAVAQVSEAADEVTKSIVPSALGRSGDGWNHAFSPDGLLV